jgi:hypothetical protein
VVPLTNGSGFGSNSGPAPAIFVSDRQTAAIKPFFAFYFLKLHLHHFSKINSHKEVTKQQDQGFSYYFFFGIERSGAGSGSVPRTNRAGSGRSKKHMAPKDLELPDQDPQQGRKHNKKRVPLQFFLQNCK